MAYKVFSSNKLNILSIIEDGLMKPTRVIFKPTAYYYKILKSSTHPMFLIDSEKRKEYIENCLAGNHVISKHIIKYEVDKLFNFDIPYFYFCKEILFGSNNVIINQDFVMSSKSELLFSIEKMKFFKNNLMRKIT